MLQLKNFIFSGKSNNTQLKTNLFDVTANLLERATGWTKQNLQMVRNKPVNILKIVICICAALTIVRYDTQNLIADVTIITVAAVETANPFSSEEGTMRQEVFKKKGQRYLLKKEMIGGAVKKVAARRLQLASKLKIATTEKRHRKIIMRLYRKARRVAAQIQRMKRSSNTAFTIKRRNLLNRARQRLHKRIIAVAWKLQLHATSEGRRRVRSMKRLTHAKAAIVASIRRPSRVKGYRFKKKARRGGRSVEVRYYKGYRLLLKKPLGIKPAFRQSWHQLRRLRLTKGLSNTQDTQRVQKQITSTKRERGILKRGRERNARHGAWQTHWKYARTKYLYGRRVINPTKRKGLAYGVKSHTRVPHARKLTIRRICGYVFTHQQLPPLIEKKRQQLAWMLPDLVTAVNKLRSKWKQIQNYYAKLPYWILSAIRNKMKEDFERAAFYACGKMSRKLVQKWKTEILPTKRRKVRGARDVVPAQVLRLLNNENRKFTRPVHSVKPCSLQGLRSRYKKLKSIRSTLQLRPSSSHESTREAIEAVLEGGVVTPVQQTVKMLSTLVLTASSANTSVTTEKDTPFGDLPAVEETIRALQNSTEDFRSFLEQSTTLLAHEYATFPGFRDSFLGGEERAWFSVWSESELVGLPTLTREEKLYGAVVSRKAAATKDKSFWLAQAGDWWARKWNREMLDTEVEGDFERAFSTGVVEGESFRYLELTSLLLAASIGREERARLYKGEDGQAESAQKQFRFTSLLPQAAEPSSSASGLARRQALLARLQQLRGVWAKQFLRARLRAVEQFACTTLGRNWNEQLRFSQRLLRQLTIQGLENSVITPKFYSTFVTEGQGWTLYPQEAETYQLARQLLAQQIRQVARRAWTTTKTAELHLINNVSLRQRQAETSRSLLLAELARKYTERQQERSLLLPAAIGGNKISLKAAIHKVKAFTKMEDLTAEKRALLSERSRNFALRLRGAEMSTATKQEEDVNFERTLQQGALSLLIGQTLATETTQFANRTQLRLPNQHINNNKELAQWGGSYLRTRVQTPRTLQGLRTLLLPPEFIWNTEKRLHRSAAITLENSSRPTRVNLHPSLFHSVINDRRQNRVVRSLQQRRLRLGRPDYNKSSTLRRRQNHLITRRIQIINTVVNRGEGGSSLKNIVQKRAERLLRTRTRRFATPNRVIMATSTSSFASRRHFALKSAQSSLWARKQEATLPAWTPHYPAHYLQRALQQQGGAGVVGGAESRKARVDRRRTREDRLRRGKPIHAEKVETAALLAAKKKEMLSAQGYARTRAVHILKTSRTRWWKPLARPLPFVSSLYRRPIVNWNYQQVSYTRPGAARPGDIAYFSPAKEMLFFSKNRVRASKKKEHLLIRGSDVLAPWATRLQKRVQNTLSSSTRDSHLSVTFAAKAIRTVMQQTDNVLRSRAQVLPRWERADALVADTKMVRLPQKYWNAPWNSKQCQFVPHIAVPAEAILAGMKKRKAPLAKVDKMRKHLLSITNEHVRKHYQREYRKAFQILQPRLEKAQRTATLAALTAPQREKIQSRYWPKDELLPNGARMSVAPAISIGAEVQLFGDQVLEQYRPMFKFLLSEEDMLFADNWKYRSVHEAVPVEDWTPEAYTEYVKWHVLKGNVPWLTESTLDEYRTRFEEETKDLATWRHGKDLPKTLNEAILRSREQSVRSGSATRSSRFLLTGRRERRLLEESLAQGDSVANGAWLQYNRRATELANTQLFATAYRRLSSRLWTGFEGRRAEITATLFALFRQWTVLQSFITVGPEFSYTLINQATSFLSQALSSLREESVSLLSSVEGAFEFERRVRARLEQFWKTRYTSKVQQKPGKPTDDFLHPDNSGIYREWLISMARYLKHTQMIFTAPTYGPKEVPTSVNFERPRARFVGAGREEGSYESFLHAFVRQTASSRFRRVSPLRFLAISPEGSEDYQQNLFTVEQSRSMRRRRYLAQKLSQIAYFSPVWREVLTLRANSSVETISAQKTGLTVTNTTFPGQYGEPSRGNSKRRFASLPVQLIFEERRENELVERNKLLIPNRAQSIEVLRQALEGRANELDFLNFQQAAGARRLPNDMPMSEQEYTEELEDATDDKRIAFLSAWDEGELEEREAEVRFWSFTEYEGTALPSQDLTSTGLTAYQDEPFTLTEELPYRDAWVSAGFSTAPTQNKEISVSHLGKKRVSTSAPEDLEAHELELTSTAATEGAVLATSEHRARREARKAAHSKRRRTLLTEKGARVKKGILFYAEKTTRQLAQKAVGLCSKSKVGAVTSRTLYFRSRKKIIPNYSRSKYRRRRFAAIKRVERGSSVNERSAIAARHNVNRALAQFVENPFTPSKIVPLAFETKLENYVDPEATEVISDEVIKSDFYQEELKLAAQYLETVGLYLPRLISFLISRRVKKENLTSAQVKGLVLATYWSVRIYLSTDDLGATLKATDKHYFRLQRNKNAVANWAEEQEYSRISRYNLRQRLQPAEVLSAPNSAYFNGDWLRWAFPTYHELYQEDARKYGKMLIDLRHIEKIVPNTIGVANSRTKRGTTSLDRRAFYLYTLPRVRSNPQFETVLRTIRRKIPEFSATEHVIKEDAEWVAMNMPWIALYRNRSHAIMARKPSRQKRLNAQRLGKTITRRWLTRGTPSLFENFRHLQLSSKLTETAFKVFNLSSFVRLNFFARGAHTATARAFGQVAGFINRRGRLLRDAEYEHSDYEKLVARAYIKGHTVSRNASGYIAGVDDELEGGSLSALSTDRVRQKSPRSRQYLVRHTYGAKIYREELLQQYARYRCLAEAAITEGVLIRSGRKELGHNFTTDKQYEGLDPAALNREETAVRRLLSALRGPKRGVIEQRAREKEYNFPNREQTVFQSSLVKAGTVTVREWKWRLKVLLAATTEQALQTLRHAGGATFILLSTRGFRRAATRTAVITTPKELMIAPKGVGTQKAISAQAQRKVREGWVVNWLSRRLQRICKLSTLKRDKVEWLIHLAQTVRARASSAWKKLTCRLSGPWKATRTARGGATVAAVNYDSLQSIEDTGGATIVREFTYFTNETFALIRAEEARLEEIVFLENETAGNTNFDHSREELFNSLTSLVAKKLRRARHWLRFFKRSIKDSWLHGIVSFYANSAEEFGWAAVQESRAKFIEITSAEKSMSVEDREKRRWAQQRVNTKKRGVEKKPTATLIPAGHFVEANKVKRRLHDVKQMTWKERSDTFYRSWQKYNRALYGAFAFASEERLRTRWLEGELFNRAIYSTNHGEFRRHHMPSEQKRFKRGHLVRRHLYAVRNRSVMMKRKRRHQMRRMNMRLHLELFGLRNVRAANRAFKKLRRQTRPKGGAFTRLQKGLMTRLSCVLMQLNLAPTAWWSRTIARYGVVRVNGKIVRSPDYQVKKNTLISIDYTRLADYKHWLTPPHEDTEEIGQGGERWSLTGHTENIVSNRGTDLFLYKGPATEEELTPSGRLRADLFRAAALDSNKMSRRTFCTGKMVAARG